ncbi:MAG: 50S ribosomal protein L11 methyltransferase [Thermodesulfobacteriota bacterium]
MPDPCLNPAGSLCPYRDLYIYYIDGTLKRGAVLPSDGFLGNWEEDRFSFLFFSKPSSEAVSTLLQAHPNLALLDRFHLTYEEWHGSEPAPFRVGNLNITFPWMNPNPESHSHDTILLDPGVVFGSGTHPTTRDCLSALNALFEREKIETSVDLGTGSGLLALAAARLGSRKNIAVDNNPLSAITARNNVSINGLEEAVLVIQGHAEDFVDCNSDLVIANIHFDVLKRILFSKGFFQKKWFILSGLLRNEVQPALDMLTRSRAEIVKSWVHEGIWHTYLGRNGSKPVHFHFNTVKG